MLDTPTAAPDITTADLERWVGEFFQTTAWSIIEASKDLPEDWNVKIKPRFRKFFLAKEEVQDHAGISSFGDNDRMNERKIREVGEWYRQAEKMLHAKVEKHFDITELSTFRFMFSVGAGITGIISSCFGRRDNLGSAYAGEDFLAHTDNIPRALPKNNKPAGYDAGDDTLFS